MISICIFTWGFTSADWSSHAYRVLWIDFNLYFYVRIHKCINSRVTNNCVVNWFQFVFLREDSQENRIIIIMNPSCELISICIFTWGFTRIPLFMFSLFLLWIDFNLYFYVRIHKYQSNFHPSGMVVNWFQFVFLREDSQARSQNICPAPCCELISICIFTWGFTRNRHILLLTG